MRLSLLCLLIFNFGCATTYKEKMYQTMAMGAAGGAAYGLSKPESRDAYALMWAGIGAAVGAIVSAHFSDPDKEIEKLRTESKILREEMDQLSSPRIEAQSSAFFGSKVPEKYRALINPGEWRVSRIDQWIEDDDNRLIHQDLVMDLIPPSLNPANKPILKKESR